MNDHYNHGSRSTSHCPRKVSQVRRQSLTSVPSSTLWLASLSEPAAIPATSSLSQFSSWRGPFVKSLTMSLLCSKLSKGSPFQLEYKPKFLEGCARPETNPIQWTQNRSHMWSFKFPGNHDKKVEGNK